MNRAGSYRLSAAPRPGRLGGTAPAPADVVLGEPPRGRIVTIAVGAVLAAIALLSALLVLIVVLVRRSRARS